MDWYAIFMACIFLLWAFSSPRDRNALRIVLIASLVGEVSADWVMPRVSDQWRQVLPSTIEVLTFLALLRWARNRTGYANAALVSVAWGAHVLCCADIFWNTDLVYSSYITIIQLVAVGQLATFHETFAHIYRAGLDWVSAHRVGRLRSSHVAGVHTPVLCGKGAEKV